MISALNLAFLCHLEHFSLSGASFVMYVVIFATKGFHMTDEFDLVLQWAGSRLVVVPQKHGVALDTVSDWYRDFQRWAGKDSPAMGMSSNVFGRHIRNIDGVKMVRRAAGNSIRGIKIAEDDTGVPFQAKMTMIAPRLTQAEKMGKAHRARPIEIALGALNLIRALEGEPKSKMIAEEAVAAIFATKLVKRD